MMRKKVLSLLLALVLTLTTLGGALAVCPFRPLGVLLH